MASRRDNGMSKRRDKPLTAAQLNATSKIQIRLLPALTLLLAAAASGAIDRQQKVSDLPVKPETVVRMIPTPEKMIQQSAPPRMPIPTSAGRLTALQFLVN
jgi:hypothetical protein